MSSKRAQGLKGEQQAAAFLERKGFSIVARNYRYERAEIDLIAQQENLLVFVEVKLRKNHAFGTPESFVSTAQAQRIINAAEQYTYENGWEKNIRFDIVAITEASAEILHIEDAFY